MDYIILVFRFVSVIILSIYGPALLKAVLHEECEASAARIKLCALAIACLVLTYS